MGREELEAAKRLHSQIKDGLSEQLKNQEYEYGVLGLMHRNVREYTEKAQAQGIRAEEVAARKDAISELMVGTNESIRHLASSVEILQRDLKLQEDVVRRKQLEVGGLESEHAHLGRALPGLHMRPLPMVPTTSRVPSISSRFFEITDCVLCGLGFHNLDITVSSCRHLYHPWCALVTFSQSSKCCALDCNEDQTEEWTLSFGWRGMSGWGQTRTGAVTALEAMAPLMMSTLEARSEATRLQQPYQLPQGELTCLKCLGFLQFSVCTFVM